MALKTGAEAGAVGSEGHIPTLTFPFEAASKSSYLKGLGGVKMSYLVLTSGWNTSFINPTMSLMDRQIGPKVGLIFPPGDVKGVKLFGSIPLMPWNGTL